MRRIIAGLFVIWVSSSIDGTLCYGWDLPLNVEVHSISFNFNTNSTSSDGINIVEDGGYPITAPEWYNGEQIYKFAYLMSTSNNGPTVRANFYCSGDNYDSTPLTIFTVGCAGSAPQWHLWESDVVFYGQTSEESDFSSTSLINCVGKFSTSWAWRVSKINGVQQAPSIMIDTSFPEGYVVFSTPQPPMQTPWVGVLDYACSWGTGTTEANIVSHLTSSLHNSGVTYDPTGHYTQPSGGDLNNAFSLTQLLYDINDNISNVDMDCRDFSNFLNVLSNSLGVDGYFKILSRSDSQLFAYNYIHPANLSWMNGVGNEWAFHQVAWYWNSDVADASADLDGEGDPSEYPCTDLFVNGNMSLSNYLQLFTNDSAVQCTLTSRLTIGKIQ
jgi:hypothetical protein